MTTIQISNTLRGLLDQLADVMRDLKDLVTKVRDQAAKEGLTKEDTKALIIEAMKKRKVPERTIREHMPEDLKRPYNNSVRVSGGYKSADSANLSSTGSPQTKSSAALTSVNETSDESPQQSLPENLVDFDVPKFYQKLWMAYRNNTHAHLVVDDERRVTDVKLPNMGAKLVALQCLVMAFGGLAMAVLTF